MVSPFAQALLDAQNLFATEAGESVDIVRGVNTTSGVTAVPGKSEHEATNYDGVTHSVRVQDFIFLVSDYQILGSAVEPAPFDRVVWVNNGVTLTFEALPFEHDESVYIHTDQYRTHFRVHYKLISEV